MKLSVFVLHREELPGQAAVSQYNKKYIRIKTGPFSVLQISHYMIDGYSAHCFLIQDGTSLRTVDEGQVEVATPLTEALT